MEPEVNGAANTPDDEYESVIMAGADPGSAAGKLLNLFLTARFARRNQDLIFMTSFRNIRAMYGSDVQLAEGWSRAFVNMTSPKIQTAYAIICDILMPAGRDVWTIDPTPEPFLPDFAEYLAEQNAQQEVEADFETFKNQIFLESQRRSQNLRQKVADGCAETGFKSIMHDMVYDLAAFGTGVVFGPFVEKRSVKRRGKRQGKTYNYPKFEHVSVFDTYPDPGARSVEDALYVCRRRVVNKAWLSAIREAGGFNRTVIDDILNRTPDGNWTPEPWETDMIITNNNNQMYTYRHRFVVYDFWIRKTGKEMMEYGCTEEEVDQNDLNKVYTSNIMVCGGQVIRAVISEFHEDRLPVYMPHCRKNMHNMWGTGFAELMFDSQAAASACERAANDTMASIARPQTVVDTSRVKMGTDAMRPHPGKLWFVNNSVGGAQKPVDIFYPPNILREVLERQHAAKLWADEETGVPSFLSGNNADGTHNRTLGGAELQWNNATNPFKTVISNIEEKFIIPAIEKMADYYLTYEFSDEIDADYKIVSNGVQGLVAKMARVTGMMELLKAVGNNDYWQSRINSKRVGEIIEDAYSLAGEQIFLNEVEANAKLKAMQEQKAQQEPSEKPAIPLRDAKLKVLSETDKGTPMYPIILEDVIEELGMLQGKPATAAALNIMREESLTAHRQFVSPNDSSALAMDVNPDGSGQDLPDAKHGMSAPTGPGWSIGQPGQISAGGNPQTAPQVVDGNIVQAPLPLGVRSLGTPKAESLVQHPERYSAEIPPGYATNQADVGGSGIPGPLSGNI